MMPITSSTTIPKFKIKEIYPTKQDGREWFINMDNPNGDGIIDAGSSTSKQPDGSWQIECRHTNIKFGTEVRMNVNTPPGQVSRHKGLEGFVPNGMCSRLYFISVISTMLLIAYKRYY
ncbi:MAG: hypothetical protein WCF23_21685 [Candidatus Nitrosopolaris sp.]